MATVTSVSDIKNLGDKILCKYTALTSGQVGYFSELGITIAPLIPTTSSATPNGSFYWVYVGKDYLGRYKFIADRNIQHNISWDALNNAGICSEKIIDIGLGVNIKSSIRLLTGGTSATDTDNEWDKIIVNSTLNNTITAGDNNIWNWSNIGSWTSSTPSTNINKVVRGYDIITNSVSKWNGTYANNSTNMYYGFRPVLLVETLSIDKFLLKKDSNYYSIKPEHYDIISHSFLPLTLSGGLEPNKSDIDTFGFDNLNLLLIPITKGGDTFKPIDKLNDNLNLKIYAVN